MRWVFWLFLFFNTAFFYWQSTQPQKAEGVPVALEKKAVGVANLTLLRERGLMPLLKAPLEPLAAPRPTGLALAVSDEINHAPPRTVAKSVPLNNVSAVLVSPRVDTKSPAPEVVDPPVIDVVMACFTLGPFQDEAAAGKMYKALLPLGITIEQRLSERRIPKNYWVYLPPQKSYGDARKKVKSLEAKGLDDMFIMGAGVLKNAVSLGLFKRKSMATARFNEVRTLDSSTVMKPQYRVVTEKWLDLTVDSAATETVARLAELADENAALVFQQQKTCK